MSSSRLSSELEAISAVPLQMKRNRCLSLLVRQRHGERVLVVDATDGVRTTHATQIPNFAMARGVFRQFANNAASANSLASLVLAPLREEQVGVNLAVVGVIPPATFFGLPTTIIYKCHCYPPGYFDRSIRRSRNYRCMEHLFSHRIKKIRVSRFRNLF